MAGLPTCPRGEGKILPREICRTCWEIKSIEIGIKWAPVRALKLPTISICIVFQGEAIGDDGKSPIPLFRVETASFRVDVFDGFLVDFWGAPNK